MPRVIVINGPVGCGKTSLLNELKTLLPNSYIIPEYIDVLTDANTNLENYLNGYMTAFDFQDYILDYYESVANCLFDSSFDFVFIERSPYEAIQVFAKLALLNDKLTQAQYDSLYQRAQLMSFYPNPSNNESITLCTDYMTPHELAQQVITTINDFDNIAIINLRASLPVLKNRIEKRGRECEIEHYTDDYLKSLISLYD